MRPVDRLWNGRRLVLLAGDVAVFCIALALTFAVRDPFRFSPSLLVSFTPLLGCVLIAAYAAGLYELRVIRDFVSLIGGLLGSAVACVLFGIAYFYFFAPYLSFAPKGTLLAIVAGAHAGMFGWRRLVLLLTGFNLVDLKILVLSDERYGEYLRSSIDRPSGPECRFVGCLADDVDLVVVDERWTARHPDEARETLAAAIAGLIPIVSITEFYESMFGRVSPEHANDLGWALDHVLPRSGSLYFTTKRACDVLVGMILLLLLAPVMLLVAAAIALGDGGTPLYGQMRVGYLGRHFRLWKFRTMRENAEMVGPFRQLSDTQDPRVTALGSILRRLRLDELPQLWNVLKGDMSLVGPRPEWIREVEILETVVPTYSLRYLVPPGITGWAQVYFRATDNTEDAIEKHNYDLYYLKHFSLALDFSILLKTIKRVFVQESKTASAPTPPAPGRASGAALDIACIVDRG
jgi:exopolysaccharide biosynthesis polyprenyl glycosylphosphotransferase